MANVDATHATVLDTGKVQSRLARVYAEALLSAARKESPERAEEIGTELHEFVRGVVEHQDIASYLVSPAIGKKAKLAVLRDALKSGSDLLRGVVGVLAQNNRLDLLRSVATAYRQLLDQQAGRIPVRVTAAVALNEDEQATLTATLKNMLRGEPVIDVRVDPELLGGLVVQVGDSVIDTSVRSRLLSLRSLLLEQ